ncbi:hypothetical protein CY35_05G005300, partial [Sphagnum magellanicum]
MAGRRATKSPITTTVRHSRMVEHLPEWSKGGDLRSPVLRHAWVQTPQLASISRLVLFLLQWKTQFAW